MSAGAAKGEVERHQAISRSLVNARLGAGSLPAFPGKLPASLESAYRVQAISREGWQDRING